MLDRDLPVRGRCSALLVPAVSPVENKGEGGDMARPIAFQPKCRTSRMIWGIITRDPRRLSRIEQLTSRLLLPAPSKTRRLARLTCSSWSPALTSGRTKPSPPFQEEDDDGKPSLTSPHLTSPPLASPRLASPPLRAGGREREAARMAYPNRRGRTALIIPSGDI
ncbi:hypothetical protein LY76DRAFT_419406 [Colletotrichum caudatum]|nr:hypothetical protein LY76DRAFT_419406 [Colletotrichum caudatum]